MPLENLTRDEAAARALLISNVAYEIALQFSDDPAAETFESVTTVSFDAPTGATTFLDLEAAAVTAMEINGRPADLSSFEGHRLQLHGLQTHNVVRVTAQCRYQHTGVGLHRVQDPADQRVYLYTHFEPFDAHQVFACFDQPDLKAAVALQVEAPAAWSVIANSAVAHQHAGAEGRKRTRFETTPRISTYLVAVVAGPYHSAHQQHGDVDMGVYVRQSLAEHLDAAEIFEITGQGLDFYAKTFGIPYPFGKYDQLFVPEFNMGAMENPGCITFNDSYIFRSKVTETARGRRANTILHEMAHMWFGDLVTMRWWDDLWLNESFATVWATICKHEATRFRDAWLDFAYTEKGWAMRQDQLPSTHPVAADMADTDAVRLNFDGITYAKGAAVLRQLVAYVGYEAFVAGLRQYFQDHQWANATFSDLLDALERSSGRELHGWADGWLSTSGLTVMHADWEVSQGRISRFVLEQRPVQPNTTLRQHRLAVGLYALDSSGKLVRTRRVEFDTTGASTTVAELVGVETPAVVLPNDDDLTFTKVRLDEHSAATLLEHLGDLEAPLARALVWAYCWDMTRDAEMNARSYVELAARHAADESETTVLERILAQASTAIELYGDPEHRLAARGRLNQAARAALEGAMPGSDAQLVWARCRCSTADDAAEMGFLRGLLDGSEVITGLTVDTDLRWQIVMRLCAAGACGTDLVDAELLRDPTDIGVRRSLSALAARPEADAKQRAWLQVTQGHTPPIRELASTQRFAHASELSLQEIGAIVAGFEQAGQGALVAPYLDQYAAAVASWWRERTPDEAEELTTGLYPMYDTSDAVVAAADRILTDEDLAQAARRIVVESKDGTQRAQRARQLDTRAASGQGERVGSAP